MSQLRVFYSVWSRSDNRPPGIGSRTRARSTFWRPLGALEEIVGGGERHEAESRRAQVAQRGALPHERARLRLARNTGSRRPAAMSAITSAMRRAHVARADRRAGARSRSRRAAPRRRGPRTPTSRATRARRRASWRAGPRSPARCTRWPRCAAAARTAPGRRRRVTAAPTAPIQSASTVARPSSGSRTTLALGCVVRSSQLHQQDQQRRAPP